MTPPRDILATLRQLPPVAWVLFAGTFVNRFGSFVQVLLVLYLTDKGYSGLQQGWPLAHTDWDTWPTVSAVGRIHDGTGGGRPPRRPFIRLAFLGLSAEALVIRK